MFGLDDRIAALGDAHTALVVVGVALLLGLRHASDPDHLAAVTTLIASNTRDGVRRAATLGIAWGAGHATTLCLLGAPIVFWAAYLPAPVQQAAELTVGLVIVALALRVLQRWRSGCYHVHSHDHGGYRHRHLHPHAAGPEHEHGHDAQQLLGRSPAQAYGIGLLHGLGGSAGVGVLLLAGIGDHLLALAALAVFATATAASMAALSCGFGYLLTRTAAVSRLVALVPALGVLSLGFGAWYALAAL